MKSILFITAFPPNSLTAGQYYTKLLIEKASRKFKVHLIAFSYPNHKIEVPKNVTVEEIKISFFTKMFNAIINFPLHPIFTVRFNADTLKLIETKAKNFDYIYIDFSQVLIYNANIFHPYKYARLHDVIYQKYSRGGFINKIQRSWVKKTESFLLRKTNNVLCASIKDAQLLNKIYNLQAVATPDYLKPQSIDYEMLPKVKNIFSLYGAWNRPENEEGLKWFFKKILPKINPNITFIIIGPDLKNSIKKKINETSNVTYKGFVENPLLELYGTSCLIAPIFSGAGVKVKVLDALSSGTPIIGTHIAFEGIDDTIFSNAMFLCNNENDFVDKINNFEFWSKEQSIELINKVKSHYIEHDFISIIDSNENFN